MRRREFIAAFAGTVCGASAFGLRPISTQADSVRRIGILMGLSENDLEVRGFIAAFVAELARLGWVDGRNTQIEQRWTNADVKRASAFAMDMLAFHPDVILCSTTPATAALHRETTTIPVVFTIVGDPVAAGFIAGLPRPGGNFTGFTNSEGATGGKWLSLLKDIAPGINRAGIMFDPETPPGGGKYLMDSFEAAARSLGIESFAVRVRSDTEIENEISMLVPGQTGLVVMPDSFTTVHIETIASSSVRHMVPAIFEGPQFARIGGLISYGADFEDIFRRAAGYVDRILRGEKPADLPVQTPTKFEMKINLKTAKALGLAVPPSLLATADEVIE
jgi:putative tryptophan/tyrosine transport system substrate-binding protein